MITVSASATCPLIVRRANVSSASVKTVASAGAGCESTWMSTLATAGADAVIVGDLCANRLASSARPTISAVADAAPRSNQINPAYVMIHVQLAGSRSATAPAQSPALLLLIVYHQVVLSLTAKRVQPRRIPVKASARERNRGPARVLSIVLRGSFV